MATPLIEFEDPESGERSSVIDLAIERQLKELSKVDRSTDSSSNPTSSAQTTTCLLDLDFIGTAEKSEPIQQKGSINSTSAQLISNDVSSTADVLVSNSVTLDKLVDIGVPSDCQKQNTLMKQEGHSKNGPTLEFLASEFKKNAIVICDRDPEKSNGLPKETVILYADPISMLFQYASKHRLKNPCFVEEKFDKSFRVKCSFSGVEGEGAGHRKAIAKKQAAENCLKNFNTAMLNKHPIELSKFTKEPDTVSTLTNINKRINNNCKPSNAIGELYEHAAKFLNARPQFESSEENGRIRTYTVTCSYLSYSESCTDKSKQKAKMEAASKVYEKLMSDSK
ncbi:hypothetical protein LSTR_LSTR002399 [Laodelphax striatellus]|uniref:DRBM domain-containing protein n=1 Tax=Laodelphax striatellus TaxID=195883 RepID=A0A482X310_LAOST|nr:hypothetical protein LSTR_LSTR002399 [Laodelphax striatellus]